MENDFFELLQRLEDQRLLTDGFMEQICKQQLSHTPNVPTHIPNVDFPGAWYTFRLTTVKWNGVTITSPWKIQRHAHLKLCRILDPEDKQRAIGPLDKFYKLFSQQSEERKHKFFLPDKQYGIVFSGGGAKGAFQIGVWKYLHENGYDKLITGISGASVGALNSLLFASGSYENAERTWLNVQQKDMTPVGFDLSNLSESFAKAAVATGGAFIPKATIASAATLSGPLIPSLAAIVSLAAISPGLMRQLSQLSFTTQKGLKELINKSNIDWQNVCSKSKLIYSSLSAKTLPHISGNDAHSLRFRNTQLEYHCWAGLTKNKIEDIVLASAALPVVYPSKKIDGVNYRDGGIQDNLPIRPLIGANFEDIVVVHLNRANSPADKKEWADSMAGIDISNINSHIHHVYPPKDFDDSFTAMLMVNSQLSQERIKQGYESARTYLAHIFPPIKK